MLLEHERDYVLGMDAPIIECTRTRSLLWFGYGCFLHEIHLNTIVIMVRAWMLSRWSAREHDRYYGFGMDALKLECTRTRTEVSLGHGSSHHRVHSNTNVMLCMDALVTVCSWNTNVTMV